MSQPNEIDGSWCIHCGPQKCVCDGRGNELPKELPHVPGKPYRITAALIADLVIEKQLAYGDSFGKSGDIMKVLYPEGIPVEKYQDALTVVRVIDKLFRIATKKNALGESPWRDIMGYSLLAVVRDES